MSEAIPTVQRPHALSGAYWPEARRVHFSIEVFKHNFDAVADLHRVGVAVDDVHQHARTGTLRAIQFHSPGDIWTAVGHIGMQRVANHDEAVDGAGAWQLHPFNFAVLAYPTERGGR